MEDLYKKTLHKLTELSFEAKEEELKTLFDAIWQWHTSKESDESIQYLKELV